jgi:hypothetical protein
MGISSERIFKTEKGSIYSRRANGQHTMYINIPELQALGMQKEVEFTPRVKE